jgi:hypothetical protein
MILYIDINEDNNYNLHYKASGRWFLYRIGESICRESESESA